MWVPGYDCPQAQCKGTRYRKNNSNTYKEASDVIDIKYGRGSIAGKLAED